MRTFTLAKSGCLEHGGAQAQPPRVGGGKGNVQSVGPPNGLRAHVSFDANNPLCRNLGALVQEMSIVLKRTMGTKHFEPHLGHTENNVFRLCS